MALAQRKALPWLRAAHSEALRNIREPQAVFLISLAGGKQALSRAMPAGHQLAVQDRSRAMREGAGRPGSGSCSLLAVPRLRLSPRLLCFPSRLL